MPQESIHGGMSTPGIADKSSARSSRSRCNDVSLELEMTLAILRVAGAQIWSYVVDEHLALAQASAPDGVQILGGGKWRAQAGLAGRVHQL